MVRLKPELVLNYEPPLEVQTLFSEIVDHPSRVCQIGFNAGSQVSRIIEVLVHLLIVVSEAR